MKPPTNVAIRVTKDTTASTLRVLQDLFPKLLWRSGHKPTEWRPSGVLIHESIFLCIDCDSELCSDSRLTSEYRLMTIFQLKNLRKIRRELTA